MKGITFTKAMALCSAAFTLFLCTPSNVVSQEPRRGRPLVHAKAMTLHQMTDSADKIFQGKVQSIKHEKKTFKTSDQKDVEADVLNITFQIVNPIKGDLKRDQSFSVYQLATQAVPLKEGDEVLWYLDKPTATGLAAPLGFYSGDFKIVPDPENGDVKVAVNANNNIGLWSTQGPLVDSSPKLARGPFAEAVQSKAPNNAARSQHILKLADKPNKPGPLPLELIITATESLLSDQHQ